MAPSPIPFLSFLHECDTLVITEELMLIRENSFKCIVYTSVHAWCSHSLGFGTHMMTRVQCHPGSSHCPQTSLCAPPIPASFLDSPGASGSHWWFYCLRTFAFFSWRSHRRSPCRRLSFSDNWLLCKRIQPLPGLYLAGWLGLLLRRRLLKLKSDTNALGSCGNTGSDAGGCTSITFPGICDTGGDHTC